MLAFWLCSSYCWCPYLTNQKMPRYRFTNHRCLSRLLRRFCLDWCLRSILLGPAPVSPVGIAVVKAVDKDIPRFPTPDRAFAFPTSLFSDIFSLRTTVDACAWSAARLEQHCTSLMRENRGGRRCPREPDLVVAGGSGQLEAFGELVRVEELTTAATRRCEHADKDPGR
jgi:hypothetical protein